MTCKNSPDVWMVLVSGDLVIVPLSINRSRLAEFWGRLCALAIWRGFSLSLSTFIVSEDMHKACLLLFERQNFHRKLRMASHSLCALLVLPPPSAGPIGMLHQAGLTILISNRVGSLPPPQSVINSQIHFFSLGCKNTAGFKLSFLGLSQSEILGATVIRSWPVVPFLARQILLTVYLSSEFCSSLCLSSFVSLQVFYRLILIWYVILDTTMYVGEWVWVTFMCLLMEVGYNFVIFPFYADFSTDWWCNESL